MAFFEFRNLKDIKTKQDISAYLVFPYRTKNDKIWLNKKAVVPENFDLVFGAKGKVYDVLPSGEHKMTAVTLPNSSKKFKLYKVDKNNKVPTTFLSQAYFVNRGLQENFKFSTYKKLRYKNIKEGRFWADIKFEIDYQITDSKKFMQRMLNEYAYVRFGECEKILNAICSEFLTDELLQDNYLTTSFTDYKNNLLEVLKLKQEEFMKSIGCQLIDLRYENIKLSKNAGKNNKISEKPSVWKGLESLTCDKKFVNLEEESEDYQTNDLEK